MQGEARLATTSDTAHVAPIDSSPLEAVARRYRGALIAFFMRRTGNKRQESEDLTQEVFLRLAGRRSADDIREVEPYVFQTAANVLTDHVRRRAVRAHGHADPYREEEDRRADFSPERVLLGKEDVARVMAAIEALPERARKAFILFRFEELKQAEIAQHMGISVSAVEKHIRLGMVRVGQALRDDA